MAVGTRNRRAGVWTVGFIVAVIPVVASSAAERPFEGRRVVPDRTSLEVVKILGPGPLPPQQRQAKRSIDRPKAATVEEGIDQCVEANMDRLDAPGAAVAVVLDGELIYETGYGFKRRAGSLPVDADTIFRIGSVTKMMTAAAVMQQVELGRVDLEAPVTDYIPEFEIGGRWPADRITVWNTLTHTSGYPDRVTDLYLVGDEALSMWAARQSEIELHAPPGSFWNYSNPNFMLAGLVAERASGTPYRDLFKESLWEAAGMLSTTFDPDEVVASGNYATGNHYFSGEDRWITVGPREEDFWTLGPAGTAFSTVGDLARWALLLMDGGGPVLSPLSAAQMQHPHQWMHYTPDLYYGLGIMIEEYEGLDVRQHGGNLTGYGTYLLWVPERRFAVALLTNVTYSLSEAAYCIVDEVLDPAPVDPPNLSTDPSTWGRYVGDYIVTDYLGDSTEATIYIQDHRLRASVIDPDDPENPVTVRLWHQYLDTFVYDSDGDGRVDRDVTFCSTRGEPGRVMWLRNRLGVGERQLAPRTAGRGVTP